MTQAQVKFRPFTEKERREVDPAGLILGAVELPIDEILIEPSS